mmetsp:Transcript_6820/g.29857  ORF Transcript_6820/g.29857 Transcript_6820/m.29857 type:complete len:204 (-) Transcript_6820:700-1311(-)
MTRSAKSSVSAATSGASKCLTLESTSVESRPRRCASLRVARSPLAASPVPLFSAKYLEYGSNSGPSLGSDVSTVVVASPPSVPSAAAADVVAPPTPRPTLVNAAGPAPRSSTAYLPAPTHAAEAPSPSMYLYLYTYPHSSCTSSSGVSASGFLSLIPLLSLQFPVSFGELRAGSIRHLSGFKTNTATGSRFRTVGFNDANILR